ncbi:MAG: hypothetical protein FWF02_00555 [Micrococcales bacterium]|nr:hypothetical protein [Micrococcales bacterium]MCL2666188.1 hypothetical protein [Micrococcales bacterium]
MRLILRFAAAAVLAGGSLAATALAASAEPSDPCGRGGTYMPGVGCVMAVGDVQASCSNTQGTLSYTLSAPVPAEQVTITITDGKHSADLTGGLSGSVPWPASVTSERATVTFTTQTTPAYTASAKVRTPCATILDNPTRERSDQPPARSGKDRGTDTVAKPAPKSLGGKVLAATGAMVGPVVAVATGLLVAGSAVFVASRRRRA